ncbi:MAG: phosphodiester glycosidase family protein [Pirellulaceae bacterium]
MKFKLFWLTFVLGLTGLVGAQEVTKEKPFDWSSAKELEPGILHAQQTLTEPRKMVVNCLRIDSTTPGIKFHTTKRLAEWENGKTETRRQTVRKFVETARAEGIPIVVAVNADAFSLKTAYNREDPCDLSGLAVTDGVVVSQPASTPSLIVAKDGKLRIATLAADADLSSIEDAVSGFGLCLDHGKVLESGPDLHPRTGFGLSADQHYLFLVTIDGRQPASAGATTQDLGRIMQNFGADTAINMDGGGSTTLVWWDSSAAEDKHCRLLNVPVGNGQKYKEGQKTPFAPSERTNGNNFGVYFQVR